MSLLGIDVGTTGCKAFLFSESGDILSSGYEEYDVLVPQPGWAEMDAADVWDRIKGTLRATVSAAPPDAVKELRALAVSSLGEAFVPVTEKREILSNSLLNFDARGEEYVSTLKESLRHVGQKSLYEINGNTIGNQYSVTKLMWIRDHWPEVYARAHKFLLWGPFVSFMLGAAPVADYSLANRTLLFDLEKETWSDELVAASGLDREKLPDTRPSGTVIGTVSRDMAAELGIPETVQIATGAHDQCANAVGCGVVDEGAAMYGMGTYICIVPVCRTRRDEEAMVALGLNTEHHAVPGRYVSFLYNAGGALFKWYRDTFAALERDNASASGESIYPSLIDEMPEGPSGVLALPHFTATGPPEFISDSSGLITGLRLETHRGDILKGLLEGATFYLRELVESLPKIGMSIEAFRAVGGGSKSDTWVQLSADILGRPMVRPRVAEAGSLGAAILAGAGCRIYESVQCGVSSMVTIDREFVPNQRAHQSYARNYEKYRMIWPLFGSFLKGISS